MSDDFAADRGLMLEVEVLEALASRCCRQVSMGMNLLKMAALNGDGVAARSETGW
jgi:hypothetical protein